jgi:hypothetical protein
MDRKSVHSKDGQIVLSAWTDGICPCILPPFFYYYYNNTICPSIFPFIYLSIYTGKREIVQVLVIPLRVSLPPTLPTEDVTPRDTLSALFPSVARHYM